MTDPADDARHAYQAAESVVRDLVAGGHVGYFAGGCVRDRLMGRHPKDYDIATDAPPDRIRELFPRAHAVGEAFGVMLVRRMGFAIEIATFRTDGVYADGRHPDTVTFTDAEHDASRRDFTINGLFEDPIADRILDYVGGQADLEARVVRAIGDPVDRMNEDRLRMLRAIRFAARFEFAIDGDTAEEIRRGGRELVGISRERIGQEVRWMLSDPNRAIAAWEMSYLGLDATVLEEPTRVTPLRRVGRLPEETAYATVLAAWCLDRADPLTADETERVVDRWTNALMLSGAERRGFAGSLSVHRTLWTTWSHLGVAAQKRLASGRFFTEGLLLVQAEDAQAFVDIRRQVNELARTGLAPTPLISGHDLISNGIAPGPTFKPILDAVYDAQLEGAIETREAALALAASIAGALDTPPAGI